MEIRKQIIDLGFKELPHFTIGHNLVYDLGRSRILSVSGLSTPNEFIYISEFKEGSKMEFSDVICLHNFDYDGYLTLEKLKYLIAGIVGTKECEHPYSFIYSKCGYEKCNKCGKVLCEG